MTPTTLSSLDAVPSAAKRTAICFLRALLGCTLGFLLIKSYQFFDLLRPTWGGEIQPGQILQKVSLLFLRIPDSLVLATPIALLLGMYWAVKNQPESAAAPESTARGSEFHRPCLFLSVASAILILFMLGVIEPEADFLYQKSILELAKGNAVRGPEAVLDGQVDSVGGQVEPKFPLFKRTVRNLWQKSNDTSLPRWLRNAYRFDLHKKFSLPVACLLIGLCALPLARVSARRGGVFPFVVALAVPGVLYALLDIAGQASQRSVFPAAVLAWLPGTILLGFLLALRKKIPA